MTHYPSRHSPAPLQVLTVTHAPPRGMTWQKTLGLCLLAFALGFGVCWIATPGHPLPFIR